MDSEASTLQTVLAARELTHLRVTKRGKALIIVSGPEVDPDPEVRMSHLGRDQWRLDLRHHAGRWEQTPFTGTLSELVDAADGIGRLDDHGGLWNPGDTSDPSH